MGDESTSVSRQREYQRRHKALGLCLYCTEDALHGALCLFHYEKHALRNRNRYRKRHGLKPDYSPVKPNSRRGDTC